MNHQRIISLISKKLPNVNVKLHLKLFKHLESLSLKLFEEYSRSTFVTLSSSTKMHNHLIEEQVTKIQELSAQLQDPKLVYAFMEQILNKGSLQLIDQKSNSRKANTIILMSLLNHISTIFEPEQIHDLINQAVQLLLSAETIRWEPKDIAFFFSFPLADDLKGSILTRSTFQSLTSSLYREVLRRILETSPWALDQKRDRLRNDLLGIIQLFDLLEELKTQGWLSLIRKLWQQKIQTLFELIKDPQLRLDLWILLFQNMAKIWEALGTSEKRTNQKRREILKNLTWSLSGLISDPAALTTMALIQLTAPGPFLLEKLPFSDHLQPEQKTRFSELQKTLSNTQNLNIEDLNLSHRLTKLCPDDPQKPLDLYAKIISIALAPDDTTDNPQALGMKAQLATSLLECGVSASDLSSVMSQMDDRYLSLEPPFFTAVLKGWKRLKPDLQNIVGHFNNYVSILQIYDRSPDAIALNIEALYQRQNLIELLLSEEPSLETIKNKLSWRGNPLSQQILNRLEMLRIGQGIPLIKSLNLIHQLIRELSSDDWSSEQITEEVIFFLVTSAEEENATLENTTARFLAWVNDSPDQNIKLFCSNLIHAGYSLKNLIYLHGHLGKTGVNLLARREIGCYPSNAKLIEAWYSKKYLRQSMYAKLVIERYIDSLNGPILNALLTTLAEQYGNSNPKGLLALVLTLNTLRILAGSIPPPPENTTDLDQLINMYREYGTQSFLERMEIPRQVLNDSPLSAEEKARAFVSYSYLAGNSKLNEANKQTMRMLVMVDLLGYTDTLKMGRIPEGLDNYLEPDQITQLRQIDFSRFPGISDQAFMRHWVAEGERTIQVNTTTVSPEEEITTINHHIKEALDHLSDDFQKTWEVLRAECPTEEERQKLQKGLASLGHAIYPQSSVGGQKKVQELYQEPQELPPVLWNMLHNLGAKEGLAQVKSLQTKLSLFKVIGTLHSYQTEFLERLSDFERILNAMDEQRNILGRIKYRTPESPGIFLWTGEIKYLQRKIARFENDKPDLSTEEARQLAELKRHLKDFADLTQHIHARIRDLYRTVEKASKKLENAGEAEAARQLLNVNHFIDAEKKSKSEMLTIQDLTQIHLILTALKEDNHCLSPDGINGDTDLSFLDPNRKLLTIRNEEGRLQANMLLNLGIFENTPCLIMDRIYSLRDPATFREPIISYLKARFKGHNIILLIPHSFNKSLPEKELQLYTVTLPSMQFGDGYMENGVINGRLKHGKTVSFRGQAIYLNRLTDGTPDVQEKPTKATNLQELKSNLWSKLQFASRPPCKISDLKPNDGSISFQINSSSPNNSSAITLNLTQLERDGKSPSLYVQIELRAAFLDHSFLNKLFQTLKKVAHNQGYSQLLAKPTDYYSYRILSENGFGFDSTSELSRRFQNDLSDLDRSFSAAGVHSLRQRSLMAEKSQINVNNAPFIWPPIQNQPFMVLDFELTNSLSNVTP